MKGALEQLEKKAEDKINKDDSIKPEDKAKAIEEAKAEIGKEALLKAIEDGVLTATQAVDEFVNDGNTKDKAPEAYKTKELTADETKKIEEVAKKEASKPIVKKLTDIADDLAEKIEQLTNEADEDKADAAEKAKVVEEKNAALDKQKETLEKTKTALETAKKNNADQAIQDGLQDAVTKLEASVASAKTVADEAQAKFDEVNEAVKAYKSAIDELTDDYNATLGYIENLKEVPKGEAPKDFAGGVNDDEATTEPAKEADEVPTVPNAPEFNGGVNDADAPTAEEKPEFNGGVNDEEAPTTPATPEFNGGVNDADAPTAEEKPEFNGGVNDTTPPTENTPEFNGGVNDPEAPTVPNNPDGEAPKPTKPETSNGDALVQPELPAFKGGVNAVEAAVNEVPEYTGGVNSVEAAINEVPEYKGGANFVLAAVNEVPEYTGPLSTNGEDATVNNVPEYGETGAPAINEVPAYAETGAPAINEVPEYTLTTAGTNKDNTYQAPAAKAEDKKELPNTGGKDNVAVASLGFLGLFLGAIPFVKRKN